MAKEVSMKKMGDWDKLEFTLNPLKFTKALENNVSIALTRIAIEYRKDVRDEVKKKPYAKQAEMTAAMKGSTMPLVDQRDMMVAITYKAKKPWEVIVGILRQTERPSDEGGGKIKMWSVADILHRGVTIRVTERMRRYFVYRWRRGDRGWRPLSPDTRFIVIPGRPFMKEPLEENQKKYMGILEEATRLTFKKLKKKQT